jgi:ABC-type phosphate transport system permease subunit
MTLLMSILVVPFGVLAALYLREYAKQGPIVSSVRIAINNLAGVPSIVFGVFGLGFFCYIIGGGSTGSSSARTSRTPRSARAASSGRRSRWRCSPCPS